MPVIHRRLLGLNRPSITQRERHAMRLLILSLCLAGTPLMATTVAPAAAPASATPGRPLTIGINQFPAHLHPDIEPMMAKTYVLAMATRPMTAYDDQWQPICLLCETFPTVDNGLIRPAPRPDGAPGLAISYALGPNFFWGDGTPVTVADVQLAWEIGRHPQTGVGSPEAYRRLYRFEAHDDRRFTVYLDRVTFNAGSLAIHPLPNHLERPIFAADPANYRRLTGYATAPTQPGLYFGPYRLAHVTRGTTLELVPNPYWHHTPPAFSRITVKTIENSSALEAHLLAGQLDLIAGELGLSVDQALALEGQFADRFRFTYRPGLVYEHIDLRLDNPVLQDRRVRHALLLGIDRQAISEQLFQGRQPVAHGAVHPLDPMYAADLPTTDYDPAAANALLDAAGWTQRRRGIRHNEAGVPLSLVFMTTAGNRVRELVQQALQSQWRQLGIDVTLRNEPPRVFFGETLSQRRFTGMALFAWISSPESVPRTTLHSAEIPRADNQFTGQNYAGLQHPRVDALIDAIETTLDPQQRRVLWRELQAIYREELPALPLYFRAEPHIWPHWLAGVVPTGHQFPSTLHVESWRVEATAPVPSPAPTATAP